MRKVKQIKEKEDENSLFDEVKYKSQAAMEYLMTYGWAILIIALSLVVLYSLGIMNPKNFIPRAPPGSCFVFRPNGPGTTDFISLQGTCGYLPMYVGSFNGVNGQVKVPYLSVFYQHSFTVTGWVNYNDELSGDKGLFFACQSNSKDNCLHINRRNVKPYFGFYSDDLAGNTYLSRNKWWFLAFTWDSSTKQRNISVNGKLDASGTSSGLLNVTSAQGIIGLGYGYMNGSIANVQIYNTALTPQEIQYLYQQGLGGGPVRLQNLVAWWPLNGDAKDYSGNNNHGTINGGVTFVQNYNPP
jgi:hypothetical protein